MTQAIFQAPYYFNASRRLWTGNSQREITLLDLKRNLSFSSPYLQQNVIRITALVFAALGVFVVDFLRFVIDTVVLKYRQIDFSRTKTLQIQRENGELLERLLPVNQGGLSSLVLSHLTLGEVEEIIDLTPERKHGIRSWQPINLDRITLEDLKFIYTLNDFYKTYLCSEMGRVSLWNEKIGVEELLQLIEPLREVPLQWISFPKEMPLSDVAKLLDRLNCSRLEGIDFGGLPTRVVVENYQNEVISLFQKFPQLTELSFSKKVRASLSEATILQLIREHRETLQIIDLGHMFAGRTRLAVLTELLNCPRLTQLKGDRFSAITGEEIDLFRQLAEKRQMCALHGLGDVEALEAFFRLCPIQDLNIGFVPSSLLSTQVDKPLKERITQFRCPYFLNEYIAPLVENCPELKLLSFSSMSEEDRLPFLEALPRWKKLTHFGCAGDSDESLEEEFLLQIIQKAPSLEHVWFPLNTASRWEGDGISAQIIENLGKLGRKLTLHIHFYERARNNPFLEKTRERQWEQFSKLCRRFPQLTICPVTVPPSLKKIPSF